MNTDPIYHITTRSAWRSARSSMLFHPASLESEGFIHCSTLAQVCATAGRHYAGQSGLVLLEIDPTVSGMKIQWENTSGGEELFPHLYGPLPMRAVLRVYDLAPQLDGTFTLPAGLDSKRD
jgi:uncharacterized protein (DUF952 family)